MKLLLLTNVYPTPVDPTKGLFHYYLARALAAAHHQVTVVAPVSWLDELRSRARCPLATSFPRFEVKDRITVHYPRYYYPPKILRSWYGWLLC